MQIYIIMRHCYGDAPEGRRAILIGGAFLSEKDARGYLERYLHKVLRVDKSKAAWSRDSTETLCLCVCYKFDDPIEDRYRIEGPVEIYCSPLEALARQAE